ncbi:Zinc finger family protein, putative isoform 1 [Hibiscus syriacus]|uniref:Zinc finger family protein, putative isoform 1 n=1 Tax=Hibiscus syriacus TaxID=106335 RepID=A0A6A2WS60_HIBSY|nr:protection of telomeres protein 1a-like [Hibiscus syriacus]KAE8663952.1 Zinc finger family protein, putative isoform 1 [Hibiscus syriacus]
MAPCGTRTIKEAISCLREKVNLFGVILDYTWPKKSKGTDYICKLTIIDASDPELRLPVHVFERERKRLPRVAAVGDIIHLSRVKMEIYEGVIYAVYNKNFSSFALYDGKDGQSYRPYQGHLKLPAEDQDRMMITGLRNWLASSQVIDVPNFLLLKEINQVEPVNIACKVLHTCKTTNNEGMIFLWDGTDAPPINITKKVEDEGHNPLSLHLEKLPLSSDVLCTFPTAGTILRVFLEVDVDCIEHILQLLKNGQWVKLFHLSCKEREGLWYGEFTSNSKIQDMSNDDILMIDRQRKYACRSRGNPDRMPFWASKPPSRITVVDSGVVAPFATLMDVLTCRKVARKFRCVIRVVAVFPWRVEDFRARDGTYRVRFTLEDPTARIHAYAFAEDGEKFFNGSSNHALKRKLDELLGAPDETEGGARNQPWVQCCLISHSGKKRRWICDTKLIGE